MIRANFMVDNWELAWRSRFIGEFAADPDDVIVSTNQTHTGACRILGGPVNTGANGPCVDKAFGDSVWYHDLSLTYDRDEWSTTLGVRNLLDEEPPLIDQGSGPARMNIVVQSTYDLFGRRAFLNVQKRF